MGPFDKYLNANFSTEEDVYKSIFRNYDKNNDDALDKSEFADMARDLFNAKGDNALTDSQTKSFFDIIDLDSNGLVSADEWRYAWCYWIKQILAPVRALIAVDVQNDFISGSLSLAKCEAGQDGAAIVPIINGLLSQSLFDVTVYSSDWHPENHISFVENVKERPLHANSKIDADSAKVLDTVVFSCDGKPRVQTLWPKHCTQGSWGSELHPDLKVGEKAYRVNKGTNPEVDSYSSFWDNDKLSRTELSSILSENRVTDVYVCGLAYDVCVGFTATHAVEHGFRTVFIEDASRGVSLDGIAKMRKDLVAKGVLFADSADIPALAKSEVRPVSLGVQAAINYKLAWKLVRQRADASSKVAEKTG